MELNITSKNAGGHVTSFNGMRLDHKNQYIEGSDDETRNFVRDLPRVEPYTGANNVRIKYEGVEYTLSYKFYTAEEKKLYDQYRKAHKGGFKKSAQTSYDEACNLVKALEASGCPEEFLDPVRAYAESLKPVDPAVAALLKAAKGMNPEDLKKILGL